MEDNQLFLEDIPVIDENVIIQQVDSHDKNSSSETVLIFPQRGEIKVINETARVIWQLMNGKTSIGEIVRQLQQDYLITENQAEKDVMIFLNILIEKKIVRIIKKK